MLKCLPRLLLLFFISAMVFSGCKLDAPVYPAPGVTTGPGGTDTIPHDTIPTVPDVDDGTNPPTDATYTVPIGAANTIAFQIDGGETVILNLATADVSQPGGVAVTGYTSILSDKADPDVLFQLNVSAIKQGEYANDLLGLLYQDFKLSDDGSGKVKFTTYKKIDGSYHIRGFFRVNATNDTDGVKHLVIGSFNIAQ